MNMNRLMTLDRAAVTYKIDNQLCAEGLKDKLHKRSAISKSNTRNRKGLRVQKH